MIDETNGALVEQLRLANRDLAAAPFYIGTTRRRIADLNLTVHFNRTQGTIVGSITADLLDRPRQPGQPHPLATTAITILGDDRQVVLGVGSLDDAGHYPIPGLRSQLRYYLHLGEA